MRTVPPWVGKTDDTHAPPRVRRRIFDAYEGRCQCGCNRKILTGEAWELDHYVALVRGGANSELNLKPLLKAHHIEKTRADVAIKAKTARVRAKHIGIKRRTKQPIKGWRKFDGTPVRNPKLT